MKLVIQSILMLVVFTVFTGIIYPMFITLVSQVAFNDQANGSLVKKDGKIIGSSLIGQSFTNDSYFNGRPSECDYDATNSGAYNYGPASSNLISMVKAKIDDVRKKNILGPDSPVPSDMVTASASGLDPDISIENASIQAKRISFLRNIPLARVMEIISNNSESRVFGFWGIDKVNVLKLNLALDSIK
jgi:K+-transporting ATPase ATPase C chain